MNQKHIIPKYMAFCREKNRDCATCLKKSSKYKMCLEGSSTLVLYIYIQNTRWLMVNANIPNCFLHHSFIFPNILFCTFLLLHHPSHFSKWSARILKISLTCHKDVNIHECCICYKNSKILF